MGDGKKVANGVVALSSAAVLAIYGAGYARTRAAADRFAQQGAERRPHIPAARGDRDAAPIAMTSSPVAIAATEVPRATSTSAPPSSSVRSEPSAPTLAPAAAAKTTSVAKPATERIAAPTITPKADAANASTGAEAATPADDEGAAVPAQAQTPAPVPAPVPVAPPPVEAAKPKFKDGTFYGWGTSRHGDIQAAVVIEEGRITVARVERCLTRYSCNWITPIPPRILTRQGTTYDYVSGATESSDAFQDAVAEALSQAK